MIYIFYFLFRQHWFITSCRFHVDKLCFYFCIPCSMLTTKSLVFIHYHKVDPIYPFCPPQGSFFFGNHYFVLCIWVFVFIQFALFIYLSLKYIPHMSEIIWHLHFSVISLFLLVLLSDFASCSLMLFLVAHILKIVM